MAGKAQTASIVEPADAIALDVERPQSSRQNAGQHSQAQSRDEHRANAGRVAWIHDLDFEFQILDFRETADFQSAPETARRRAWVGSAAASSNTSCPSTARAKATVARSAPSPMTRQDLPSFTRDIRLRDLHQESTSEGSANHRFRCPRKAASQPSKDLYCDCLSASTM